MNESEELSMKIGCCLPSFSFDELNDEDKEYLKFPFSSEFIKFIPGTVTPFLTSLSKPIHLESKFAERVSWEFSCGLFVYMGNYKIGAVEQQPLTSILFESYPNNFSTNSNYIFKLDKDCTGLFYFEDYIIGASLNCIDTSVLKNWRLIRNTQSLLQYPHDDFIKYEKIKKKAKEKIRAISKSPYLYLNGLNYAIFDLYFKSQWMSQKTCSNQDGNLD